MLRFANRLLRPLGLEISKKSAIMRADMEPVFLKMLDTCLPFTMTSVERMYGVFKAVEYLEKNHIPGDIVECGVWKGGSSMMAMMSLLHFGNSSRNIYLYDTFEGMSTPSEMDVSIRGEKVHENWESLSKPGEKMRCDSGLAEVKENVALTKYPENKIHYVEGKVEDSIPSTLPGSTALLRLDTDWYESTKHEMEHLYPLLVLSGVMIVDDYGHWAGARKAVDEYMKTTNQFPFLHRLDYTGRLFVRTK
jgi:hypothetical protein